MTKRVRRYTEEELQFLREFAPGRSWKEIAEEWNKRFDPVNHKQIGYILKNHGIKTGRTGRFPKGHVPYSKGKKMSPEQYEKCKATMFRSGHKPKNWEPIGTEKIKSDGYIWVKVSDEPGKYTKDNWRQKHRLIWEQAYGPIPDGMKIIFLDGNKMNITLDNLAMVEQKVLTRMNQNHLIYDDPESTKAGIAIAEVLSKIGDLERGEKNG